MKLNNKGRNNPLEINRMNVTPNSKLRNSKEVDTN